MVRFLLWCVTIAVATCSAFDKTAALTTSVTQDHGGIWFRTHGQVIAVTAPNGAVKVQGVDIFKAVAELCCRTQVLISQTGHEVGAAHEIAAVCERLNEPSEQSSPCGEEGIGLCSMQSGHSFALLSTGNITFSVGVNGTLHAGTVDIITSIRKAQSLLQLRWPALSNQPWEDVLSGYRHDDDSTIKAICRPSTHGISRDPSGNMYICSAGNVSFTDTADPRLPVRIVINSIDVVSTLNDLITVLRTLSTRCAGSLNRSLDCANKESRAAVRRAQPCQVQHVTACCCDEFFALKRIQDGVSVAGESRLQFGNITFVGGIIKGQSSITDVDFGQVTHAGGIDLKLNKITRINFNSLVTVRRYILIYYNQLRSLNLGKLESVGDNLDAGINSITSVDLGALTFIGGKLELHSNRFTRIDLKGLRKIDGALSIHDGMLQSIDLGELTSVRRVSLYRNDLTTIDLSPLAQDRYSDIFDLDVSDNQLTSVIFGGFSLYGRLMLNNNRLTSIDFENLNGRSSPQIFIHHNDLTELDCQAIGNCVCADTTVILRNCPGECQHCDDYREFPY